MFDRCLYFNINALTRLVNKQWNEAFETLGLSPAHGYLLRVVLAEPGISQKHLAAELRLEKSTVTRFIDVLEKKDLVLRNKTATADGRELNIYPTAAAEAMHVSLEGLGEKLYQSMVTKIGKEPLEQLVQELRSNASKIE